MSGSDTFLGRWSRLKRSETAVEPETERHSGSDEAAAEPGRTPAAPPAAEDVAEDAPEIASEDLPRIEDMTPESDVSAFLKKGVPKTLKAAALRRAWALDPAIRDYVGPQEYAWDFNDPASMHGFGGGSSMEELGRAVRSLRGSDKAADAAAPGPSPSSTDLAPAPPGPTADATADSGGEPVPESIATTAEVPDTSPQDEAPKPRVEAEQKPGPGRRHGGAIPT